MAQNRDRHKYKTRSRNQKRHIAHYSALLAVFTMLFMQLGVMLLPKSVVQNSALMNCPMHAMMKGDLPITGGSQTTKKNCSYCMVRNASALEQGWVILHRVAGVHKFHQPLENQTGFYKRTAPRDNLTRGPPAFSRTA